MEHYVKINNLIYSPPRNRMGKGDVLIRSVEYAIARNDHDVLEEVHRNLKAGRRWPPEMDLPDDKENYRSAFKVTRDPIILFLAACKIMDREDLMDIKFPIDVWRPHTSAWRRYLIKGKGKWLYEVLELINLRLHHKMFSYHLCAHRTYVTGTDRIKKRMNKLFPPTHWNTLIKVLIMQNQEWLDGYKYEAEVFLEREVYTWSKEDPYEGKIIDQSGILIAKGLLWWAIDNIISYLYSAKRN
jgi:hypothetical protein